MKKKKNIKKTEKNDYKNRKFDGVCYYCSRKGHMSKDCWEWKYGNNKKFERAKKAIDGNEDDMILCLLTKKINGIM